MEHDAIVRRVGDGLSQVPLIVARADQEFIAAILDQLVRPEGVADLVATALNPPVGGGAMRLYQPVHRTFHIAMVDVACNTYGLPRLDPERIESAGLVVRRIRADSRGRSLSPEQMEGWVQDGRALRGWVPFGDPSQELLDPEPERRPAELSAGNPVVDSWLASLPRSSLAAPGRESSTSLFVAPPEVCAATRRSILYGMVPLTSDEQSERPPEQPPYDEQWFETGLRLHLPPFMRAEASQRIPYPDTELSFADAGAQDLADFLIGLRQIRFEFDALGDSPPSRELFAQLNRVSLRFRDGSRQPMGDFLRRACQALLERGSATVLMPVEWPQMDAVGGAAIFQLVKSRLRNSLDSFVAGEGRYDSPDRSYRLRAFVRVRRDDDGCPPVTIWSDYSQPFTIARWYEPSDAPPVRVELPDILKPNILKELKPNVAFSVPSDLFNFLNSNDPKNLLAGKGSRGAGPTLDWICSFSIPIITLCAFIVLNIFLMLFDLIFQWMLFIKICIPFPRRS
jgi:hypothetical protein